MNDSIKYFKPKDPSKFFKSLLDEIKDNNKYEFNFFHYLPKKSDFKSEQEYKNYYDFTKVPMSFNKIRELITKNKILSINDFLQYSDLIFYNCTTFNKIDEKDDWNSQLEINSLLRIANQLKKNIDKIIIYKVTNIININNNRVKRIKENKKRKFNKKYIKSKKIKLTKSELKQISAENKRLLYLIKECCYC